MIHHLMQREAFHLAFLLWLMRRLPSGTIILKGGVNLRFFFGSPRYSEDMDLDVAGVPVFRLRDTVMDILDHREFKAQLKRSGIADIVPPDMRVAKQTETVQRFKVHLLTAQGLDLFTKIEFSRRGIKDSVATEAISNELARAHHHIPFVIAHYDVTAAARQKIRALVGRARPQARDVFDLFVLMPQLPDDFFAHIPRAQRRNAVDRILEFSFDDYNGSVVEFLNDDDRLAYGTNDMWENIQLRMTQALEVGRGNH